MIRSKQCHKKKNHLDVECPYISLQVLFIDKKMVGWRYFYQETCYLGFQWITMNPSTRKLHFIILVDII